MQHLTRLLVTALFAALLAACGGEPQASAGLVGRAELQTPLKARMELRTP